MRAARAIGIGMPPSKMREAGIEEGSREPHTRSLLRGASPPSPAEVTAMTSPCPPSCGTPPQDCGAETTTSLHTSCCDLPRAACRRRPASEPHYNGSCLSGVETLEASPSGPAELWSSPTSSRSCKTSKTSRHKSRFRLPDFHEHHRPSFACVPAARRAFSRRNCRSSDKGSCSSRRSTLSSSIALRSRRRSEWRCVGGDPIGKRAQTWFLCRSWLPVGREAKSGAPHCDTS
jgi:hypothetical protein